MVRSGMARGRVGGWIRDGVKRHNNMDWSNDGEDCRRAVRQRGILRTLWTGSQASTAHPGPAGMRRGVRIEDILDALEHPVQVTEIAVDKSGLRSYIIFGTDCSLAVNPDTNGLIQVNPVH